MAIEIRRALKSDIPELARLVLEIAAYHESIDERTRFDWEELRTAPQWLEVVLSRDHHAVWVADHGDGRLVGYLWIRLQRQRQSYLPKVIGYINQAYLSEHWRGKGLIRPMLDRAYEWFSSKGVAMVALEVHHRNWIGSAAWYRLGFMDWRVERLAPLKVLKR